MIASIAQTLLRTYSSTRQHERVDPDQKGLFQNRMEDYAQRYQFAQQYVKDKRVLDIACGEGYGTSIIAPLAHSVVGVDTDIEAITFARERYGSVDERARFVHADALDYLHDLKNTFDVILSFETIEHVADPHRFLALLHKTLKVGGTLLLSTQNKLFSDVFFGGTANPYHVKEFYIAELRAQIKELFHLTPTLYLQGPIAEGAIVSSTLFTFFFRRSKIIQEKAGYSGLNMIFAVTK
ncbi:MAG: putative S-adenosylmethionine-dependent methyltransferase [Microgenomates bacterium OLB22]|nr:MAG: putative S-adenosylmethionine-dependent methyltransferase [Microgenomates bacterium OLB22]